MQGFDAREWLRAVSGAARLVREDSRMADARRELASSSGPSIRDVLVASTPSQDVMARYDAIIDADEARQRRISSARAVVAECVAVMAGMRLVGEQESAAADVLELVYVELVPRAEVARLLRASESTVRRRHDYGCDWLDAHGVAHAKAGTGSAEG